jgi:hypothetical protein
MELSRSKQLFESTEGAVRRFAGRLWSTYDELGETRKNFSAPEKMLFLALTEVAEPAPDQCATLRTLFACLTVLFAMETIVFDILTVVFAMQTELSDLLTVVFASLTVLESPEIRVFASLTML